MAEEYAAAVLVRGGEAQAFRPAPMMAVAA